MIRFARLDDQPVNPTTDHVNPAAHKMILGRNTIEVHGKKTAYSLVLKSSPPVVFISALGDRAEVWRPIFYRVAKHTTVFAYDRPGYGKSEDVRHGKEGRDGVFVARHLNETLNAVALKGPFVLVAHSIGGLYALSYAKLYPDDIAGLVLLDIRTPTFSNACAKSGSIESEPPWYVKLLLPRHVKAEVNGARSAEEQSQLAEDLGDIPVSLVSASKKDCGLDAVFFDLWQTEQQSFAHRAVNGRIRVAQDSAHYVHHDDSDLVIREIRTIIDAIRAK